VCEWPTVTGNNNDNNECEWRREVTRNERWRKRRKKREMNT
jgi:hypothetical protein